MDGGGSSLASPPQAAATELEEYQNWKKNSTVLYDLVISRPLEWPSLTVEWLPSPDSSTRSHRLVLGTHTSEESPNHLMLVDVVLPLPPRLAAAAGGAVPVPSVSICRYVPHRGEVNRARCMPQQPYTVATKTCVDEVHVFHLGDGGEKSGADVVLRGHDAEGYGLAWSPMKDGWLLSGSYDKKICLWDLAVGSGALVLDAQQVFEAHEDVVEDVAWHLKDFHLFGSVGDDCKLMVWDLLRTNQNNLLLLIIRKSTLCPSIHLTNGSWLQHLEMRLLSYLICENYQEACTLSTAMRGRCFRLNGIQIWRLY